MSALKSSIALVTSLTAGLTLASALAASTLSDAELKKRALKASTAAHHGAATRAPLQIKIAVSALDLTKLRSADFADGDSQR